jgi:DNA-directed RNA polymerase specialized sigma24 family protein
LSPAEDYADEVIERILKQIAEGKNIEDVNRFAFGVAKFVLLESHRRPRTISLNSSGEIENENGSDGKVFLTPRQLIALPEQDGSETQEKECLKECLQKLPSEKRGMLLSYYEISESSETNIEQRRELAARCKMRVETLYTAICRLRKQVSDCSKECVKNMSEREKNLSIEKGSTKLF